MSLNEIFNTLGSPIILPVFIFTFAILLRVKAAKAFRSAVMIGIALFLINILVGFLTNQITPSVNDMVANSNVHLPYIDVGWGAAAAIAFASKVGLLVIPFAIVVNIIVLALRLTDTLNIDIWNYWHYAFVGALTAAFTGSMWLAFLAALVAELFSLFLADWMQPSAAQYYDYEGVSFTTISSVEYIPFAIAMNWVLDKIGIGKIHLEPKVLKKRLQFFGEPAFLGLVIGLAIGLVAYWHSLNNFQHWVTILLDGIATAAFVEIFPHIPALLMEGLVPISNSLKETLSKRKWNRTIYLGMDTALCVGETSTLTSALLLIPIAVFLMVVLPFNKFLWIADLTSFPWFVAMMTPITHGNILKNVIIGACYLILGDLIITKLTPLFTQAAVSAGSKLPAGAAGIGAGSEGISYFHWVIYHAMAHPLAIVLVFLVYGICVWALKHHRDAMYKAVGYIATSSEPNIATSSESNQ